MDKNYYDSKLIKVSTYLYWMFMLNFLFILTNIIFIFAYIYVFISLQIDNKYYAIYYIILILSIIPGTPAIKAILKCGFKANEEQDLSPVKDFFNAYREGFFKNILVGIIIFGSMSVCVYDNFYFKSASTNGNIIMTIGQDFTVGIVLLILLVSMYLLPIRAKFNMKIINSLKLAFYVLVKEWKTSLVLAVVNVLVFIIIAKILIINLIIYAIWTYIVVLILKKLFADIDKNIISKSN